MVDYTLYYSTIHITVYDTVFQLDGYVFYMYHFLHILYIHITSDSENKPGPVLITCHQANSL